LRFDGEERLKIDWGFIYPLPTFISRNIANSHNWSPIWNTVWLCILKDHLL
jgi:hypothetical protein